MAENSKIEWTHHTANLWWGCTKVHAGCDHCYAEAFSNRFNDNLWGNDAPRKEVRGVWRDLAKYQRMAEKTGESVRVFVGSMMDIFEKPMPVIGLPNFNTWNNTGEIRNCLFERIDEGRYPNLIFLFLTKRPSNINKMIPEGWKENPPGNVMFGCSPVDQKTYNKLVPELLMVNGKRFLSIEPQLGEITPFYPKSVGHDHPFAKRLYGRTHIDWVIVGGESGHGRRPFDPEWARTIRDQCEATGTPFFMKQIDKVIPIPEDLMIRQSPFHE